MVRCYELMRDLAFGIKSSFLFLLVKQGNIPAERCAVPQEISIYFIYLHLMTVSLVLHKLWLSSYLLKSNIFLGGGMGKEEGRDPGAAQYSIRNNKYLFIEA